MVRGLSLLATNGRMSAGKALELALSLGTCLSEGEELRANVAQRCPRGSNKRVRRIGGGPLCA
jgi:hypothetical protein